MSGLPDAEARRAQRDQRHREREMGHRAADGTLKKPYRTKAGAKKARKLPRHVRADSLQAYRCPVCDQWHLGNRPS